MEIRDDLKTDLEKLKDTILNDYQYFDRRYDTVTMVFAGFGLYGCFEILKWYLTNEYTHALWLAIPILLWLVLLFIALNNIKVEKRIREMYLQQIIHLLPDEEDEKNNVRNKSIQLEDFLRRSRNWVFGLSIFNVVLMLLSLGSYLISTQ